MNVKIACVGRLKEQFWKDAVREYEKRLSRYAHIKIVEVEDEKAPEKFSVSQADEAKRKEGEKLLRCVDGGGYVIALDVRGEKMGSERFAALLEKLALSGKSTICFLIGGSLGLSPDVLSRADMRLSFSDMTFSHQLMRPVLMEQIYRAFKIIRGETYHK